MTELSEPELNRSERFVRDRFLRLLPGEFGDPEELNDEKVQIAKSILAKNYVEHTNIDIAIKTGLMLLVYDWLFYLDSQVYGLFLASLGSIALALPKLHTPHLLAEEVFKEPDSLKAKLESEAKSSVKTNTGVAGLFLGFILQIFAIAGPLPDELVVNNVLHGEIPTWAGFVVVVTAGHLTFGRVVPAIRERFF